MPRNVTGQTDMPRNVSGQTYMPVKGWFTLIEKGGSLSSLVRPFFKCVNHPVCNNNPLAYSQCAQPYAGIVCESCQSQHYSFNRYVCSACTLPSSIQHLLLLSIKLLLIYIYVSFILKMTLFIQKDRKE